MSKHTKYVVRLSDVQTAGYTKRQSMQQKLVHVMNPLV